MWDDAERVAALLAADPFGCGGVVVRAGAGPARDLWLTLFRAALPSSTPWRRLPPGIADDRLLGGLDLAATLRAGRPVAQAGLLAEAHGGIVVVPMAERLPAGTVARLCAALDTGNVSLERDGLRGAQPARFGLVLLDEGGADETVAEALVDRLAFRIDLTVVGLRQIDGRRLPPGPDRLRAVQAETFSRMRPEALPSESVEAVVRVTVRTDGTDARSSAGDAGVEKGGAAIPVDRPVNRETLDPPTGHRAEPATDPIRALCLAAEDLGVVSLRGPLLAGRVARLAARIDGTVAPSEANVIEAARLVLSPRASRLPAAEPQAEDADESSDESTEEPAKGGEPPPPAERGEEEVEGPSQNELDAIVLEAARAAIPPNLLARLLAGGPRLRDGKAGRMGLAASAPRSGRPAGSRPGDPRRGRLDLIATLRAAAPWQRLRRAGFRSSSFENRVAEPGMTAAGGAGGHQRRIVVLPDDLRIKRLRQHTETTTIFCVDASGSAALERLAETKGAVELLLAESYVRRDRVALVAFRGAGAEVILPPTRSLARAKRVLGGLPGGGGTPLAVGIDAAATLALAVRRGGGSPVIVLLTDGRANVARSGEGGRARAGEEALAAGRLLKALGLRILLIDTGARPDGARRLAAVADARYIPLPYADAGGMSAAVRAAIA